MYTKVLILFLITTIVITMAKHITLEEQWESFKTTHGKSYDPEENGKRFAIFKENVKKIEEHNQKYATGEVTYTMGINQFTDLTPEEFKKNYLGLRLPKQDKNKENP